MLKEIKTNGINTGKILGSANESATKVSVKIFFVNTMRDYFVPGNEIECTKLREG
ncbi:hypothetical protein BJQ96_02495 [Flavobacterium sp. PL0002]|nr:hypothetical protein [Flavobacterium sp. PL002]